jgi:hypothetical protein
MKYFLGVLSIATLLLIGGCTDSDRVKDPEALYQQYLKDDAARQAKVKECKLLSVDKQMKSQSCAIALKAEADKEMKKHGGVKIDPLDLSK